MRNATILFSLLGLCLLVAPAWSQSTELELNVPTSEDFMAPYTSGLSSGARDVSGPHDLDGDGQLEILLADYTGGGRVHVIENVGVDTWELAYMTPWLDSTATTNNIRTIAGGDLDGDGNGEIVFLSGRNYSETGPYEPGLFVFEFNGTDFGTEPTTIYTFDVDLPDRWRAEQMIIQDVDGDGTEELMFGNNGANNDFDSWYVLSVGGDIGSGFEFFNVEARLSSRVTDYDPVARGGGSPYAIHPADLDGDGTVELALHSWNNFNLTTGDITGADTYVFPGETDANGFLNASDADHVSLFGGVVVDIDGNGDDEVFFPTFQTNSVTLLNYEEGEDPLQITPDNVVLGLAPTLTSLGLTAGDIDGDGQIELIGSGPSYSAGSQGAPTQYVRVTEFLGGDPEDPANYSEVESLDITQPYDTTATTFNLIRQDSAGVMTEFLENPTQGPVFVSKLAYLGDPDNDGQNEVALAFQGVDDSTFVIQSTYSPSDSAFVRETVESRVNENRVYLRVISGDGTSVSVQDERIILPSDYKLSGNYPNPFNPTTSFDFTLPIDKAVSVRVYDVTGRLVKTLIDGQRYAAGTHQVTWDGTNNAGATVASGTYLYSLEWGSFRQSRSMVLIK
ncbi:MAG: FG-GAP-like repeat-containing protein [Bacteroidota bacterium]